VKVHLSGHLNFYEAQRRSDFEVYLAQPMAAVDLIRDWGIPAGEVFLVTVNNAVIDLHEAVVADADHLGLYPPAGGG
jgi:hypothetical protein